MQLLYAANSEDASALRQEQNRTNRELEERCRILDDARWTCAANPRFVDDDWVREVLSDPDGLIAK